MCAAKPRRFPPLRPGAGYIALSRRHGSALYTGHPLGRRSGPICVFPGRATEAVEAAHVPVHPPYFERRWEKPAVGPFRPAGKPVHSNNPPPLTTVPRPKFPSLSPFSADLLPRRLPLICPWSRRGLGGARIRFRVTMRTLSSAAIIFRGQGVERGGGLLPAGLHPNNSCLTVCPTQPISK